MSDKLQLVDIPIYHSRCVETHALDKQNAYRTLVFEVPNSGKHHRQPMLVGGRDHLCIFDCPARLDDAVIPAAASTVAKWEESVRGQHRPCDWQHRPHRPQFH